MAQPENQLNKSTSSNYQTKKRKRWEAKQARQNEQNIREADRESWMNQNSHFCSHVDLASVQHIRKQLSGSDSTPTSHNSHQTLALAAFVHPYIDMKDGPPKCSTTGSSTSQDKLFIAEGTETVRLLIQKCNAKSDSNGDSPIKVLSLLMKPATLFDAPVKLLDDVQKVVTKIVDRNESSSSDLAAPVGVAPPFHILVGSEQSLSAIAGFHIARGALACGVVPQRDEAWLEAFLAKKTGNNNVGLSPLRILALDGISDTANMGSMIRCAAAFGIDVILLSNDCCDAWYRRSVRVSMGHIFNVPTVRVDDLASIIYRLSKLHCIPSYAAVIDSDSELVLERINQKAIPKDWCCVMGNEANGISAEVVKACFCRLRIDMVNGVDSLSVPIATGIILHGLRERENP